MSDYNKTTNFTAKDSLTTGDPEKVILGSDMDTELDNIETASGTKLDKTGGTLTGALTATAITTTGVISTSEAINESKGSDIASATTTDIGAATGNFVDITGTITIEGFGTVQAGTKRTLQFDDSLTLTYNATSMILPGDVDIITEAGDIAEVISLGSGNWLMTNYQVASLALLIKPSFSVHRNGTNQINITSNDKIEWTTKDFDTNSDFDETTNYRHTPTVAGKYLYSVAIKIDSAVAGDGLYLDIVKNGSLYKRCSTRTQGTSLESLVVVVVTDMNGSTDYIETFAENVARNTSTLHGPEYSSYFTGCKID